MSNSLIEILSSVVLKGVTDGRLRLVEGRYYYFVTAEVPDELGVFNAGEELSWEELFESLVDKFKLVFFDYSNPLESLCLIKLLGEILEPFDFY